MKSVFPLAIQKTYEKHFGTSDWTYVLRLAKLDSKTMFFSHQTTEDKDVIALMKAIMEHKELSLEQFTNMFGEYWINEFTAKHYFAFCQQANSSKEFLLDMNHVHKKIGANVDGAAPPMFTFEELEDGALKMGYLSDRNMIEVAIGHIKSVGKKFNEEIKVTKLNNQYLKLEFSSSVSE